MRVQFLMLLVLMASNTVLSQEYNAAANYNYTMFYNRSSASLNRHQAAASFSTGSWKYAFDINSYTMDYQMSTPFSSEDLENVLSLQGSLSYKKMISPKWDVNLSFEPRLIWATGQNAGLNNIIPEGSVSFSRKFGNTNKSSVSVGAGYSTIFGKPALIPLVSYQASIKNFSIRAGIPETVLTYDVSPQHSFNGWARASSFYVKSNGDNYFTSGGTDHKINALEWVDISAGLGYKYQSQGGWDTILSVGKTLSNTFEVSGYGDTYTDAGFGNSLSISLNFIYKLNFKK